MCELNNLVCLTCLMMCLAAGQDTSNSIVQATNNTAHLGDLPYRVDLKCRRGSDTRFTSFCGGVLIGESKVLTSAACIVTQSLKPSKDSDKYIDTDGLFAVAATLKRVADYNKDSTQWRKIVSVLVPKNYNALKTTIALAYTEKKFNLNTNVAIMPYASKDVDYAAINGYKCMVSGFGIHSNLIAGDIATTSEYLQYDNIELYEDNVNNNPVLFINTKNPKTKTASAWDTGAPLVCWNTSDPAESARGLVVGVNEKVDYCFPVNNTAGSTKVIECGPRFSRVSGYYDFITNKSSSLKGYLCIYCFIFTLCQNFMAMNS